MADFVQIGVAGELDHGRGSTHQDEAVITGWRQVFPHHVLIDEALTVLPVWNTEEAEVTTPVEIIELTSASCW